MARETRQEARERVMSELMTAARRQLAEVGATGLSLREVARDLGMVSSAVYRYVDSRDDLLTRLIIEAYDDLGGVAERTSAAAARDLATGDDLGRWIETARAIRQWAIDHPEQYLLIYGTPVPGYAAPEATIGPAARVTLALVRIVTDAADAGRLAPAAPTLIAPDSELRSELSTLEEFIGSDPSPESTIWMLAAWTQMFGLIMFELTNQTRNVVESHHLVFDATVTATGHAMGLRHP